MSSLKTRKRVIVRVSKVSSIMSNNSPYLAERRIGWTGAAILTASASNQLYGNVAFLNLRIGEYGNKVFSEVYFHYMLVHSSGGYYIVFINSLSEIDNRVKELGVHKITYRANSCLLTNTLFDLKKGERFTFSTKTIKIKGYEELGEFLAIKLERTEIRSFAKGELKLNNISRRDLLEFKAKARKLQKKG